MNLVLRGSSPDWTLVSENLSDVVGADRRLEHPHLGDPGTVGEVGG